MPQELLAIQLTSLVPFKGSSETTNALLGGHIDAVADSSGWAQLVNAGRFRLLVTWGAARTKSWPDVPTLREVGIDIVSNSPFGIAGPKGMDPKVVKVLHDAFKKGMEEPSYLDTMAKLDQESFYLSSDDYQKSALQQIDEARRFIPELGLGSKAGVRGGAAGRAGPISVAAIRYSLFAAAAAAQG